MEFGICRRLCLRTVGGVLLFYAINTETYAADIGIMSYGFGTFKADEEILSESAM